MKNNIRKQFVRIALLLALGTVTAAHAVSQPIQTRAWRGSAGKQDAGKR